MISFRTWRFALILAAALPTGSYGQDTTEDRPTGKPLPKTARHVATKGIPKRIELSSEAASSVSVVEFLIREFPRNGEISVLRSVPNDRSKVFLTYTARRNTAATSDYFTFAVRYPGGLYSKPVKVEIDLKELEPFIKAPARVEFGRVMIGRSVEKEFFIQNTGNAPYQHNISLSSPWFLVEPAQGALGLIPGAGHLLRIRFTPTAAGPTETEILFNRNPGGSSYLEGAAFTPFSLETSQVVLRWENKTRTRIGEISVKCHSLDMLPVTMLADRRLKIVGGNTQFLEPEKTANLRVYLPAKDPAAFDGQIQVVFGSFSETVKVAALAPPAYFVIDPAGQPDGSLSFGQVEAGKTAMQSFQLRNIGGTTGEVRFSAEAPFSVLAPSGKAILEAQQAKAFAVQLTAPRTYSGVFHSDLKIESDTGQSLKLPLHAAVFAAGTPITQGMAGLSSAMGAGSQGRPPAFPPAPGAGASRDPDAPPDPSRKGSPNRLALEKIEALRSPLGFITQPTIERFISENIPNIDRKTIKPTKIGRQQLGVSWPVSRDDLTNFEIEMRMNRLNSITEILESIWVPHHDVSYGQSGNRVVANIRGLAPNRTYEFRIFTLGTGGKVSPPTFLVATTKMPLDWTWIYVACGIILLAGITWLVWKRTSAQWKTFD